MSETEIRFEHTSILPKEMTPEECCEAIRQFMIQNNLYLIKTERTGAETHTTYGLVGF